MGTKKSLYIMLLTLLAAFMSPAALLALDVRVININLEPSEEQIREIVGDGALPENVGIFTAEIFDGTGWTVKDATARTYKMYDGSYTKQTEYGVFGQDGIFIRALVKREPSSFPGGTPDIKKEYFYQLSVTFTKEGEPDKVIRTDCFNSALTLGAVWLTDIDQSDMILPDTGKYLIGFNKCPNGEDGATSKIQINPGEYFENGVSLRLLNDQDNGMFNIHTERRNQYGLPFTYTRFSMGYQAYKYGGATSQAFGRIEVYINNGLTGSRADMKAYSRPDRGTATYNFDRQENYPGGINWIGLKQLNNKTNPTGYVDNYANLAACRLYYTCPVQGRRTQTMMFDQPGGVIYEEQGMVELSAFSTGHTTVTYTIEKGSDLAEIISEYDDNLRRNRYYLKPKDGRKGVIVVKASTEGDKTFAAASASQTYHFNFASTVEYLYDYKPADGSGKQTIFFYVQAKNGRTLESLDVTVYDNVRSLANEQTIHITNSDLDKYKTSTPNVYAVTIDATGGIGPLVYELSYKFSGIDAVSEGFFEDRAQFVYLTDLAGVKVSTASGDAIPAEGTLANSRYEGYKKGYLIHAPGSIETPESFDLSPYERFCVDLGGQKSASGSATSGRVGYSLYNGVSQAYLSTGATDRENVFEWDFEIESKEAGKTIRLEFDDGGDSNADDLICVGAPRFYLPVQDLRQPQTITWISEETVNPRREESFKLEATSSSGHEVLYHLLSGSKYAYIDGKELKFTEEAMNDTVQGIDLLIEAYQPGNNDFQAATPVLCNVYLRNTIEIEKGERIILEGPGEIEELVINADGTSSGQAVMTNGLLHVKRLVLNYTFEPGKWHHIAFPADLNLDKVGDFNAKGFTYSSSTEESAPGHYYIREYDTRKRAENANNDPWTAPATPEVKGHKGYIMKVESTDNKPVEVTFVMNNISMDFEQSVRGMYLSLDMTECEPQSRHTVYISPKNVEGNTLRVDVRYVPDDMSNIPVNHAYALSQMRVTSTPVRGKIRLMLPDQSYCRVGIYDKKGEKLLKAVNYVAPMQIDISDLKPGQYLLTVAYGPAYREMLVDL